jgi:hypothetical protein
MEQAVLGVVALCSSERCRRFGVTCRLHLVCRAVNCEVRLLLEPEGGARRHVGEVTVFVAPSGLVPEQTRQVEEASPVAAAAGCLEDAMSRTWRPAIASR